jgi:hypothetical protein
VVSWRDKESEETLARLEQQLGASLPRSVRWLLSQYGYSECAGISNVHDCVSLTRVVRELYRADQRYVVLEDWDDGGLLVVDTGVETSPGQNPVYAWVEVGDLEPGREPPESARFASFGAYVEYRFPSQQQRIEG